MTLESQLGSHQVVGGEEPAGQRQGGGDDKHDLGLDSTWNTQSCESVLRWDKGTTS